MNQRIQDCFLAKKIESGSCCWASLKPSWRHSFEFSELAVCICVFANSTLVPVMDLETIVAALL